MTNVKQLDGAIFQRALAQLMVWYPKWVVSKLTAFGWEKKLLARFSPEAAAGAMWLYPDWFRGKEPTIGDIITIADAINRHGYGATERASQRWHLGIKDDEPAARMHITEVRLLNAVAKAHRDMGNASSPQLPESATPSTEEEKARERQRARDFMASVKKQLGLDDDEIVKPMTPEQRGLKG